MTTTLASAPAVSAAAGTPPRVPLADSVLVGLAAAVLYAALAQKTCYGDGASFLLRNDRGMEVLATHCAWPLLLRAARAVVEPLGGTLYQAGMLLSVAGGALGCALMHRAAAVLGIGRADALLAALLVVTTPAVTFFSTVVELHGPFLGFVGVAVLAFARWRARPSPRTAAVLGVATAAAYFAHATGIVLPGVFLLLAAVWPHGPDGVGQPPSSVYQLELGSAVAPRAAALRTAWIVLLSHGATCVGVARLLRAAGLAVDPAEAGSFLLRLAAQHAADVHLLATTTWVEWLLPYAPLSLLWLAVFAKPARRAVGLAFGACVVGYLVFTFLLLGSYPEHGAYLLPLAWPAAMLVTASLPRAVVAGAIVAGLALGTSAVARHDQPERGESFARGLRQLFGDRDVLLLLGDHLDVEARFVWLPRQPYWFILDVANLEPTIAAAALPHVEAHLRALLARHDVVVLTARAEQLMADPAVAARGRTGGEVVLEFLRERFQLERVASDGFAGFVLRPRPG